MSKENKYIVEGTVYGCQGCEGDEVKIITPYIKRHETISGLSKTSTHDTVLVKVLRNGKIWRINQSALVPKNSNTINDYYINIKLSTKEMVDDLERIGNVFLDSANKIKTIRRSDETI